MNNSDTEPFVVTIDGPAGSGKGTISKLVSKTLGFRYLDSGAIYRIIALNAKTKNLDSNQITQILDLIDGLEIKSVLSNSAPISFPEYPNTAPIGLLRRNPTCSDIIVP